MEPEGLLQYSQQSDSGTYTEPYDSSPHPIFLRSVLLWKYINFYKLNIIIIILTAQAKWMTTLTTNMFMLKIPKYKTSSFKHLTTEVYAL
jgi:hypothetical protein